MYESATDSIYDGSSVESGFEPEILRPRDLTTGPPRPPKASLARAKDRTQAKPLKGPRKILTNCSRVSLIDSKQVLVLTHLPTSEEDTISENA
ncbi:hypothetical protein AVEN_9463-1 [Araneus ventricosus]|uniref:Uncharacterized protein n=1 Tax=Araneus ventricosus TaxID=182803 RepID=A0A4Y2NE66_ARAVE|nr:hypothetical protein AVEN_9463-1 [Araneus ventricosus]